MSKTYKCLYCHKPIDMKLNSIEAKMMEFFDMPEEAGAHQKCLENANMQIISPNQNPQKEAADHE